MRLTRSSASIGRGAVVERCVDELVAFWVRGGMAFRNRRRTYFAADNRRQASPPARPQRMLGGAAVACTALACGWILWANLARTDVDRIADAQATTPTSSAYAKLAAGLNAYARRAAVANSTAALLDSRFSLGGPPATFIKSAALEPDGGSLPPVLRESIVQKTQSAAAAKGDQLAQSAPPPRVPPIRAAVLREAARANRTVANTSIETPTIFERLFGRPSPLTLAYANPDDGLPGAPSGVSSRYDRLTAVYDISAHTVYLPDGTRLEAHSGYGGWLDDPRHADQRMRGATPPNVYDLKPREGLFHGVQALRLIPVDEEKTFGRTGLLAHTFMLGPNGQSNGCVSFRNYDAFLQAYLDQKIKRLAVVARLD
jgi:Protein of unknown function (DUF2778)